MNIYWCNEKDEPYGLFVMARTRGRAKARYAAETECDFTEVRTQLMRRGVNEPFEGVIGENSSLLKKYGLEYSESEEYT